MESLQQVLEYQFGGYRMGDLLLSFGLILLTLVLRKVLVSIVFKNLLALAQRTAFEHDDQVLQHLRGPLSTFIVVLGFYLAIVVLPLDVEWQQILNQLFRGVSMALAFWALLKIVDVFTDVLKDLSRRKGTALAGFLPLINKSLRAFLIVLGVIMVLDNLGYSVGGIIAGLGIGGAAFAFAAKDTIANIYGSMALALDRPFKVGDWIQVGDEVDGDVESIGLRSTRVRTWPKTVLSIPNSVLANETINNWSKMPKRRVKQVVGVTYETTAEQMEELVEAIRQLLREDEGVQQDFILVNFTDFGSSSLDILVYYFTTTVKWLEHMDVRQRINCKIMRAISERGLSVAFPTRTLYFEGDIAKSPAGHHAGNEPLPGDHGPQTPA